jgi:hypothetical protein
VCSDRSALIEIDPSLMAANQKGDTKPQQSALIDLISADQIY